MKFFKEVFYPKWRSKTHFDKSKDGSIEEDSIAITARELADWYKSKFGRSWSSENIRKTYLEELHNNGIIEEEVSKVDKRHKIYYPLINDEQIIWKFRNPSEFRNFLQHSPILLPRNCKLPNENWLIMEILSFLESGIGQGEMEIFDKNGTKQTIKEFISEYERLVSLIPYFKKGNYRNFSSEIFGEMKYLNGDTRKDEKNSGKGSDSGISAFLNPEKPDNPNPTTKPEPEKTDDDILSNLMAGKPPPRPT